MKRRSWLFWFAVFTASLFTLFAVSVYVLLRSFQASVPSIEQGSVVSLDLAQPYPEEHLYDVSSLFAAGPLTFRDLLIAIARAKEDARVDRLLLRVRGSALGWAHVSELRARLADFKSSGKGVVAYVEYASSRDYAVASVADEIRIHPRGFLDLRGLRAELTFLGSTFDKLGVEAEFERIGEYKDAPDTFLREEMSPESREAIGTLVTTLYDEVIASIAEGRKMTPAEAETLVARGPFTAEDALQAGLVDGTSYRDEVLLAGEEEEAPPDITIASYGRASSGGSTFGVAGRIAIIYGIGAIVSGENGEDAMFGRVMGADTIAQAFRTAREDDSIDAVVFRIDSPGGSDVASDVIWREASRTRERKPVVVSMGDVAASGGYWIATASDAIVAEPTTITGSIGIFAGKFNFKGLYDKIGVSKDGVSTSPNADFFSDSRSFTDEERAKLHHILESGYQAFLERVAASRDMTTEEVDRVARGRVWSGKKALELGLVDELGGLYRALDLAKERAGMKPDDRVEVRILPEKKSLFEALLANLASGVRGLSPNLSDLTPEAIRERSPLLALVASGRPLALMPFAIDVY